MRLNLTQHSCTPEQGCTEPTDKARVRALLTFDEIPSRGEIASRALELAKIARSEGAAEAMIGGAPFLMPALETALVGVGIMPLYAFSRREAVEEDGVKRSIFRHVGFVPACEQSTVDAGAAYARIHNAPGGYPIVTVAALLYQPVGGRKGRSDGPPRQVCALSPVDRAMLNNLSALETAAETWRQTREQAAAQAREEWIASLPDTICGYRVNKSYGEIEDDYGNYIASLPETPMPLDAFEAWAARLEPDYE